MLNINEVHLLGRLADDPTFGTTANGRDYMRLRVITSKSYRDGNEEWQERTTGHNVVTFDRFRIQHGRDRLRKGVVVYVEGENEETRREVNGQTTYYRGVLVPMGGKLHLIDTGRSGDRDGQDQDRQDRNQSGNETGAGKSGGKAAAGKSKDNKGKVADGPPIDGRNPIDDYDDEIPF
jgi:single stranded DNA-binding protein